MVNIKRGKVKAQSQIITTVLIILVVLVAVVIVWNVVQNMVTESADDVDVQPFALDADLSYYLESGTGDAILEVKRGAGGGEINEIRLIFTLSNGSTITYLNDVDVPDELEKETYRVPSSELGLPDFSDVESVSVHYGYGDDEVTYELDNALESSEPTDSTPTPSCVANVTCASLDYECGSAVDDCGDTLDCGSCASGSCVSGNCVDCVSNTDCNLGIGEECNVDGECVVECAGNSSLSQSNAVYCSSVHEFAPIFACNRSIDGIIGTTWASDNLSLPNGKEEWITRDLGSVKCVSDINIFLSPGYSPEVMDISISNNNEQWIIIKSNVNVSSLGVFVEIPLDEIVKAKYVRLNISESGFENQYAGIAEFEVRVREGA